MFTENENPFCREFSRARLPTRAIQSLRGTGPCLGMILVVTLGGRDAPGTKWVEARDSCLPQKMIMCLPPSHPRIKTLPSLSPPPASTSSSGHPGSESKREDQRKHPHCLYPCPFPRSEAGLGPWEHQISGRGRGDAGLASGAAGDAPGILKAVCISLDPKPVCLYVQSQGLGIHLSFPTAFPLGRA